MPQVLQTPAATLEQALPKNPKHGDLFKLPDGMFGGSSFAISLQHQTKLVGTAMNTSVVPGHPDMVRLNHVAAHVALIPKMLLGIANVQKLYTHMRYNDILGWYGDPKDAKLLPITVTYVRLYSVEETIITKDFYLYKALLARHMPPER